MNMEADERPNKLRKLSHDGEGPAFKNASSPTTGSVAGQESDRPESSQPLQQNGGSHDSSEINASSIPDDVRNSTLDDANCTEKVQGQGQQLSKNQLKKLRKKLEWEAGRDDRKSLRKEKLIAKRERRKLAKQSEATPPVAREHVVHKQLPITIIIDCDFDEYMHDGERTSLASQVTRSYSDNKNAPFRAHLTISSFGGHLKQRFEGILDGMYKNWRGVRFREGNFVEVAQQAKEWMIGPEGGLLEGAFHKYNEDHHQSIERLQEVGEVVYLSAEADETLEELKPFSTYIIGGLVDKNREKGLCHRRAVERGIRTARLPIGEYLDMSSRKVLTTNHVNEIMLKWLETADWGEAFIKVIPARKGGQLRGVKHVDKGHMKDEDGVADKHISIGSIAQDDLEHEDEPTEHDSKRRSERTVAAPPIL